METGFPAAENRAAEKKNFEKEFLKAGTAVLGIKRVFVELKGEYFVSQRDIRKIRQDFADWLMLNYKPVPVPEIGHPMPGETKNKIVKTIAVNNRGQDGDRIARTENVKAGEEYILPLFCPETDLEALKNKIVKAYQEGVRSYRVTSLYQFELLKDLKDIEINTGLPLPVTNRLSIETLKRWGVNRAQLWVELEKEILIRLIEQRAGRCGSLYLRPTCPFFRPGRNYRPKARSPMPAAQDSPSRKGMFSQRFIPKRSLPCLRMNFRPCPPLPT